MRIWYNHGYSQTRDALTLLRRGSVDDLALIASHARADAAVLSAADIGVVEPEFDRTTPDGDAAYVDWCLEFARAHAVDIFVPQRGRSAVAHRADAFAAAGVRLLLAADAATLDTIEDKARFYRASAAAGLPVPLTFEVSTVVDFDAALMALDEAGHDACIKSPQGSFGAGYWRLCDDAPLFAQLMDPDARQLRTATVRYALTEMAARPFRLLVMQHLPGVEWSIDCICRDGTLITGVARRKLGGVQALETSGAALALAARVAAAFGLSHLVNIQLKAAADGTPQVLEINPRMSGGCLYAEHAGLNLPDLQLRNALGRLGTLPPLRDAMVTPIAGSIALPATPHALRLLMAGA